MKKIIFVYNTPSGIFNKLSSSARKTFSPDKHPCKLYVLMHGPVGMRNQWKSFVHKLDVPSEFLHFDEVPLKYPKALYKNYPQAITYPCALLKSDAGVSIFLSNA